MAEGFNLPYPFSPKSAKVKALYYRTTQLSVSIDHALARVTLDR